MTPPPLTTNEIVIRAIDEKIAALKVTRALFAGDSSEIAPVRFDVNHVRPHTRPDTITLPEAITAVLTTEYQSAIKITAAIMEAEREGRLHVRAKVTPATVRTALSKLHGDRSWQQWRSGAGVHYRKGPQAVTKDKEGEAG